MNTYATSNCLSPGHTRTSVLRHTGNDYRDDARTVAQGAATPCYVATAPALAKASGEYFSDFRNAEQSPQRRDAAMAARLWEVSEQWVQADLPSWLDFGGFNAAASAPRRRCARHATFHR